jgi:hypothetical protein
MPLMRDLCDLRQMLRPFFFPRDRDISLQAGRNIYLSATSTIYIDGGGVVIVPVGGIILWSGSVASIPTGWQICDGTNGTPDLRDRFVVGAGSSYAVGATGGSTTKDVSHTHGPGTLATDTEANHSHTSGTLATDSDNHSHTSGTLSTDSDGHSHTMPGLSVVIGNEASHTHDPGTFNPTGSTVGAGLDNLDGSATWLTSRSHTHTITGTSGTGSSHTHTITGDTYTHDHTHNVTTGSTAADSHSHTVNSGSTGADGGHSHTVNSGVTGSGGSATQDILPPYYALAYIQRIT